MEINSKLPLQSSAQHFMRQILFFDVFVKFKNVFLINEIKILKFGRFWFKIKCKGAEAMIVNAIIFLILQPDGVNLRFVNFRLFYITEFIVRNMKALQNDLVSERNSVLFTKKLFKFNLYL